MVVHRADEIEQSKVETEGARGVSIRWLLSKEMKAPNFAMREFEIEPCGHTPFHAHDWEHEVYVLSGKGAIVSEEGEKVLVPGTVALVLPGEKHRFKNTGEDPFRFLCLVPHSSG